MDNRGALVMAAGLALRGLAAATQGQAAGDDQQQDAKLLTPACLRPHYPAEAVRDNVRGTTTLRLTVGEEGKVSRADIVSSSGSQRLDKEAARALSSCTFKPAMKDGKAITSCPVVDFRWDTEEKMR